MRTTHAQDPDNTLIANFDVVVYTLVGVNCRPCRLLVRKVSKKNIGRWYLGFISEPKFSFARGLWVRIEFIRKLSRHGGKVGPMKFPRLYRRFGGKGPCDFNLLVVA